MILCCSWMAKAQERGTDNEGYGPLVEWDDDTIEGEGDLPGFHTGCELPRIAFCPWCGTPVRHQP